MALVDFFNSSKKMAQYDGLSECKGSNFRHFTVRADIQLFLTSTKMIQFKCYINVS